MAHTVSTRQAVRAAHRLPVGLLVLSMSTIAPTLQAQSPGAGTSATAAPSTSPCGPLLTAIEKTLTAQRVKETLSLAAGDDKPTQLQFVRVNEWEYFDERGRWEKERLKNTRESQLGSVLTVAVAMAEDCKPLGLRKVEGVEARGFTFLPGVRVSPHDGEVWIDVRTGLVLNGKSRIKDGKTLVHYTYRYEYGPKVVIPKDAVDVTAERQRVRDGKSSAAPAEPGKSDTKKAAGK